MFGSQHPAWLAVAVALAPLFALTLGADLAVVLWGSAPKVRDVLQLLLFTEGAALAWAIAWCFAP